MLLDGAKTVAEADPEVSEAIDFARYYAGALRFDREVADCRPEPLGLVVVTPPWNFPLAIPAGGVLAALMAGNVVILKPAREAVLVGWHLAQALWTAGIPKEALQFLPCPDDEVGRALVTDPRVDAVILTGSAETARLFLEWRPDLRLFAETSGKNSLIVTALADRDQAIKDLIRSAFGHNGQKCSAASLAICEAEVYDDPAFRRQLRDAAASLAGRVGLGSGQPRHAADPAARPELQRALTSLDDGETWLLEPRQTAANPRLWSPGIKLGVRAGLVFPPHRVLRPGPRPDAGRGPRPGDRLREWHRFRPDQRPALAGRSRDGALAGHGSRPATSTSTATPPARSSAANRSAAGNARWSGRARKPAGRTTCPS